MGNQPNLATRNELPESMRHWKKDIGKGAFAAIQVYESLDGVLYGDGKLEHSLYGLSRDELLTVDPLMLEVFLDDLRDLREQAEYAVEAMEAVMATVQGGE
jgi:hypothetical protein